MQQHIMPKSTMTSTSYEHQDRKRGNINTGSHGGFHKKNSRTMRHKCAVSGRMKMPLKNKHLDARKETEKKKKGRKYARPTQRLHNHGEDGWDNMSALYINGQQVV